MKNVDKKWYQKVSSWIIIVLSVIFVGIIAMNLSIMIQSKKNPDKVPTVFGYKPFIVLSGSMETKIKIGDLIITKEVDPSKLVVNDVIAFRDAQDTVTTHRIIDIVEKDGESYFVTKGDNNNSQDQNLVEYSDVEGIYLFRIPGVGSALKGLSEPVTIVIVILGITVIFGAGFVISTKKAQKVEDAEFLEFKRMKEEALKNKGKVAKETTTKKVEKKATTKKVENNSTKKKSTKSTK